MTAEGKSDKPTEAAQFYLANVELSVLMLESAAGEFGLANSTTPGHVRFIGEKMATTEPSKTNTEEPKPSPRKLIIATLPRLKKPTEQKKPSPKS